MAWKLGNLVDPFGFVAGGGLFGKDGMFDPNQTSDREKYNQQLQQQFQSLMSSMPNMTDYYGKQRDQILASFKGFQPMTNYSTVNFNPVGSGALDKYFGAAKQGLNQTMASQVTDAASQAAALAASRGFASPSGFVSNQTQNVRESFNPRFSELEAEKARSMMDLERYNNQMQYDVSKTNTGISNQFGLYNNQGQNQSNQYYTQLLTQLAEMMGGGMQTDFSNKAGLFNTQANLSQNYDPYTSWDKFLNFGSNALPAAASLFGGK